MLKDFIKHNNTLLLLSFLIGAFFAFQYIGPELKNPYSVQDDFRQSFFWLWQYYDSSLLNEDFFAEMYKSHITRVPILNAIFSLAASLKINLLMFSKYFAIVIGILSSVASYLFISTVSKNKILNIFFTIFISFVFYCTDHISAAQARSFIWLGLMLYLYFKSSKKELFASATCFSLLFVSPNTFLLCFGMEAYSWLIESVKVKKLVLSSRRFISCVFNGAWAVLLYKVIFKDIQTQGVGTAFTKNELMNLPEFNPGGRHPIFGSNFADGSWFRNEHWGFGYGYLEISKLVFIGLFAVMLFFLLRYLLKDHQDKLQGLALLALSSISLYFASQIVFPMLYLPSRYIAVPTMILAIAFSFLAIDKVVLFFQVNLEDVMKFTDKSRQTFIVLTSSLLMFGFFGFFFFNSEKYIHLRFVSMNKRMAQIFSYTPKDSLIAGYPVLPDLNSASITTKRKIFVDYERSMAYTKESLTEIRRRNEVAIAMTFAKTKEEFLSLAKDNGITHFLALIDLYSPQYLSRARYLEPYNALLRQKIQDANGKFYLQELLDERRERYALIDVSAL